MYFGLRFTSPTANVRVVGFGKAVLGMAAATADLLAGFVVSGVLSLPYGISRIGTVHYSNLINKIFRA